MVFVFIIMLIGGVTIGVFAALTDSFSQGGGRASGAHRDYMKTESKPKKHSGRCDGTCTNCPPHYGYRYGRWYYGHNHIEGCQFGGNKGGGGRD